MKATGLLPVDRAAVARVPPFNAIHEHAVGATLPAQPPEISWTPFISGPFDALGNAGPNAVGNCAVVGAAQITRVATAVAGHEIIPTEARCRTIYGELNPGFRPDDPATDTGLRLTDVLAYWQSTGFDFDGSGNRHKILCSLSIDPHDRRAMGWAIAWGGNLYLGQLLPQSILADDPETWDVAGPGLDGHCTVRLAWLSAFSDTLSWGESHPTTAAYDAAYVDQMFAVFTEDWKMPDGSTPPGFSQSELGARIRALAWR